MKYYYKEIIDYPVPNEYINNVEKDLYMNYLTGVLGDFISSGTVDVELFKVINRKKNVFDDIGNLTGDALVYDNYLNLVISILNASTI